MSDLGWGIEIRLCLSDISRLAGRLLSSLGVCYEIEYGQPDSVGKGYSVVLADLREGFFNFRIQSQSDQWSLCHV